MQYQLTYCRYHGRLISSSLIPFYKTLDKHNFICYTCC
uniref:Uncharacterized protein n=1 Tax=Bacteriophage sp. TaxID=38018 RepID=A0A8D9PEF4_9VIRU|nr:MAG TPA: hypothetical protein [Bacteriophage sp.]